MLLGPDEFTATSRVDDDSAMGQQPLRQVAGERQCSGLRQSSREQAHGLWSSGTASAPPTGPGTACWDDWPMQATAQPWSAEGRPSPSETLLCLHTRSSGAQAKDCKRCKRNSGLGPCSKRMDPTPISTDPRPHGMNARPETPLFSCTFSCRQEKRVLDIAENPCYH